MARYGTGATIRGHDIWPCLLVDYAFALLFGIVFQYFSIAPMSGEYGLRTVWRAAKADFLSLTSFEVGLFGWMVIYQVAIWNYQLEMNTWLYWWMMQVSFFVRIQGGGGFRARGIKTDSIVGGHDLGLLHGTSRQLVAYQQWNQGAMRLIEALAIRAAGCGSCIEPSPGLA